MKIVNPLVKVCGMRDPQNVSTIAALQPHMMGFIFFRGSKRYVADTFHMPAISDNIQKVGVFVDETPQQIVELLTKYNITTVQLHGNESTEVCLELRNEGFKVMKAFGIDPSFNWDCLPVFTEVTDGFVFDTKTSDHGGSGRKFNWDILKSYTLNHPFLLSGGINPDDADALSSFFHPSCIGFDVNSGFETAPAFKDVKKLEEFLKRVRG